MSLIMKADVAAELSKRLKSGDYAQGDAFLCQIKTDPGSSNLFCCLGVLSEMALEAGAVRSKDVNGLRYYADLNVKDEDDYGWYSRTLAPAVVEWAGIKSDFPRDEEYGYRVDDYEGVGRFAQNGYDANSYNAHGLTHISLAVMNDSGTPFEEIATYIDEKVVKE